MAVEDLAAVLAVAEDLVAAEAVDLAVADLAEAASEAALIIAALALAIIIAHASLGGVPVTTVMAVDLPAVVWEAF